MSASVALQTLVFNLLKTDSVVAAFVNGRVYDDIPPEAKRVSSTGAAFPYVSFGPYDFVSDDSGCIAAGEHTLQVDVWSRDVGSVEAKALSDAVRSALHGAEADMGAYGLVEMRVDFVRVAGDPDGLTTQGIVTVTALIEEPA